MVVVIPVVVARERQKGLMELNRSPYSRYSRLSIPRELQKLGKNSERKNPGTNETEQTQAAGFPSSFRFERRLLVRRPVPFRFERRLLVRRPVPFRFSKWNGKKNLSLTFAAFRRTRQREVIVREPIPPGQNNRGNFLVCKLVSMKSHLDHIPRRNRGDIKKFGGQAAPVQCRWVWLALSLRFVALSLLVYSLFSIHQSQA